MKNKGRPPGVSASPAGIEQLKKAKGQSTYPSIATKANVEARTVRRFFSGEKVDPGNADAIIKALKLEDKDILSSENSPSLDEMAEETIEKIEALAAHGTNSERASELLKELEEELKEYQESSHMSREAMDWLKGNRYDLVKEAREESLKKFYGKDYNIEEIEHSETAKKLDKDLLKYLQLLYSCLMLGTLDLVDEARRESLIPLNLDCQLYVKALEFIKDEKVTKKLPQKVAQELVFFLDYLVKIIPIIK